MHTSTSPQYAIIASCDVSAAMMEPPGGTALVEESIIEALDFRRAMRKVDDEWGKDWWFKVWGPEQLGRGRHRQARRLDAAAPTRSGTASASWRPASTCSIRSRRRSSRRASTCRASSPRPASRRRSSPSIWPSTASSSRRPGLYSFFIMFTIGITKGRWNTLVTALQQFKDDYDKNQPLWRILPEFCAQASAVRAHGPARPVPADPRHVQGERRRARDHRDVPVGHAAGDEALRRLRLHGAPRDRSRRDRRARRPRDQRAADAVSAGHSAADPGRALQPHDRRSTCSSRAISTRSSPASTPTSTAWSRRATTETLRYYVDCVRSKRDHGQCPSGRRISSAAADRARCAGDGDEPRATRGRYVGGTGTPEIRARDQAATLTLRSTARGLRRLPCVRVRDQGRQHARCHANFHRVAARRKHDGNLGAQHEAGGKRAEHRGQQLQHQRARLEARDDQHVGVAGHLGVDAVGARPRSPTTRRRR